MIYLMNKGHTYQVWLSHDGTKAQLHEETGFSHMGEALQHIELVKQGLKSKRYAIERDEMGHSYGLFVYNQSTPSAVITSIEGWQSQDEVNTFLRDFETALFEGTKVI
jgi:hypothetical protein